MATDGSIPIGTSEATVSTKGNVVRRPSKQTAISPLSTKDIFVHERHLCPRRTSLSTMDMGAVDAPEDYFLGANRSTSKERDVVHVSATSYIDSMVDRYLDNEISQCKRPASWGFTPADDTLTRAYEAAINDRTTAPPKLFQAYNSRVDARTTPPLVCSSRKRSGLVIGIPPR
eukprot:scaffold12291_cov36-Phaeocystis_antarctica.AAC.1